MEGNAWFDGEGANIVLGARRSDASEGVLLGRAKAVEDLRELIDVVSSSEDGLATEALGKNTTDGPNIDRGAIVGKAQHDLGCTVPPRSDIFRHESSATSGLGRGGTRVLTWRSVATRKAKVTDLQLAVCVEQDIAGFEVTVKDVGRVDVLETAKRLIHKALEMSIRERLSGTNNSVKVCLHELFVEVYFVKDSIRLKDNVHIIEASNILVATEVVEELDFSETSLGEDFLGTDIRNLFDRAALSGTPVLCSDDETVGALSEFLVERIILIDDERLLERSEGVSLRFKGHSYRILFGERGFVCSRLTGERKGGFQ